MIKKLRIFSTVLMMALGLAAVVIGILAERVGYNADSIMIAMLSIGGAALFGASLSMVIDLVIGNDMSDIRHYLLKNEKFESAPERLKETAGIWYVYYLSKSNGVAIWKSTKYNFRLSDDSNSMRGDFSVTDDRGNEHKYLVEAGVRGDSLIIISKPASGDETDSIEIVKRASKAYLGVCLGIQLLETWDGDIGISYGLYSRDAILDSPEIDDASSEKLFHMLNSVTKTQNIVDLRQLLEQG